MRTIRTTAAAHETAQFMLAANEHRDHQGQLLSTTRYRAKLKWLPQQRAAAIQLFNYSFIHSA